MNRHERDDRRLADLLHDAVADVTPGDRLAELRERTASRRSRRPWLVAGGGAALATAAVVTAIALAGGNPAPTTDPGPAGTSSAPTAVDSPSDVASSPPASEGGQAAVPAYFVGDSPTGPRLFREFQQVVGPTSGLSGLRLLETGPKDPDYRTLWPIGSFDDVSDPEDGAVEVSLGDAAPAEPSDLALQQVAYTVNAGFQEPLQVVLRRGDVTVATITAGPQLEVLSLINLSDPSEGQVVAGTLHVKGVANSYEATVLWEIRRGSTVVDDGYATASGWMDKLYPFSKKIDVSSLDPGTYTLIVETDDPSGGAEGFGPYSDTRTFVIE